jgi:predicted GIY-YIG superfamily endonuclease
MSVGMAERETKPHILYRFYDRTNVLLYVGITVNLGERMQQHAGSKDWWLHVDRSATRIEYFDTRSAALDAERDAIKSEKPLHNDQHNEWIADLSQEAIASLAIGAAVSILGVDEVRLAEACAFTDDQSRLDEESRAYDPRVSLSLAGSLFLIEALASDVLQFRRVAQMLVEAIPPEMRLKAEEEADHDHFCAGEADACWEERIGSMLRHLSYSLADHFGREKPRSRRLRSVA